MRSKSSSFVITAGGIILVLAGWSVWTTLRSDQNSATQRSMDVFHAPINASASAPIEHEATRVAQSKHASMPTEPVSGSASSADPDDGGVKVPKDYPFDPKKRVPWFEGKGAQYDINDRARAMTNLSGNLNVNPLRRAIGPRELELIHLECSFAHDQFIAARSKYSELHGLWASKAVNGGGGVFPERFASEKDARAFLDSQFGTGKSGEWNRIASVCQAHENGVHFWRASWADPYEELELYRAQRDLLVMGQAFTEAIRSAIARLPPS